MIEALAAVLLCAVGHLFRDGTPPLGSTQIARAVAGVFCVVGALLLFPLWVGVAFGLAVWVGFYSDQQHAKGQQARGWQDAGWLAVSGVTSLAPIAIVAMLTLQPWAWLVFLAGALKPAIWFGAYEVVSQKNYPTRPAAVAFGALVGVVLVGLSTLQ